MKNVLIVRGGWDGHFPEQIAQHYVEKLKNYDAKVVSSPSLKEILKYDELDMLICHFTMSDEMNEEILNKIKALVENGTILYGMHNGILDAFRGSHGFQAMAGGQFIEHYGGGNITFEVFNEDTRIFKDIEKFEHTSEQYYLLVDPAVDVLMYTYVAAENLGLLNNGKEFIKMPVTLNRKYGKGEVLACSLGHDPKEFALPAINKIVDSVFTYYLGAKND